uniref:Organ specific protein n=1 Tax=Steinernema glaseri TaxID=37863 RepID=A0A1I7Z2M5_9BILA
MARLAHLVFCFLLLVSMASGVPWRPHRPRQDIDWTPSVLLKKREAKQAVLHGKNGQKDSKAFGPGSWEFVYGNSDLKQHRIGRVLKDEPVKDEVSDGVP